MIMKSYSSFCFVFYFLYWGSNTSHFHYWAKSPAPHTGSFWKHRKAKGKLEVTQIQPLEITTLSLVLQALSFAFKYRAWHQPAPQAGHTLSTSTAHRVPEPTAMPLHKPHVTDQGKANHSASRCSELASMTWILTNTVEYLSVPDNWPQATQCSFTLAC